MDDNEKNLIDQKFSVVIPYYAQSCTIDLLKKQLNYYHVNPIDMEVILAVSGDDIVKQDVDRFIIKLNDPRFRVLNTIEKDIKNWGAYTIKVLDALKKVTTPYVIINGADDAIIPEVASESCKILENNLEVSGVKGYTIYYYRESGQVSLINDVEFLEDRVITRLKKAIMQGDLAYYLLRRTKDLVKEFENIFYLSKKSKAFYYSPDHITSFAVLSVASLGKILVLKKPWRLSTVHKNSSVSYAESGFRRWDFGSLDRTNYEWYKSVTKNMQHLSYNHFRYLWVYRDIITMWSPLKQIAYRYLYKKFSLKIFSRLFLYFILYKAFIMSKKVFGLSVSGLGQREEIFYKTEHYKNEHYDFLKKYYFSDDDMKLIESRNNGSRRFPKNQL